MWFTRVAVGAFVSVLVVASAVAQDSSDGIRVRESEKSVVEQSLVMLNDYDRKDVNQFAIGITLYAEAKAESDGLIAELEHELGETRSPNWSVTFELAQKDAVDKRVAFTSFVASH
jgi:hypothetical protein